MKKDMDITDKNGQVKYVSVRDGIKYNSDNSEEKCADNLIHEHFLNLNIRINNEDYNSNPAMIVKSEKISCTASHLKEMIFGRLYTNGCIDNINEIKNVHISDNAENAEAILAISATAKMNQNKPLQELIEKRIIDRSSNIIKKNDKKTAGITTDNNKRVDDKKQVFELADFFKKDSELHRKTGSTHSAYLRIPDGSIHSFEDISRHNALDKAIGYMLINKYNPEECMIYTTGRVPTDMVEKILMAGFKILISKSVPTDAALDLATRYGLTVLCKTWPDSYVIYE